MEDSIISWVIAVVGGIYFLKYFLLHLQNEYKKTYDDPLDIDENK